MVYIIPCTLLEPFLCAKRYRNTKFTVPALGELPVYGRRQTSVTTFKTLKGWNLKSGSR